MPYNGTINQQQRTTAMTQPSSLENVTFKNVTLDDIKSVFDDYVYDGERGDTGDDNVVHDDYWVYVCDKHAKQYQKLGVLDELPLDESLCGVIGCKCTADFYLDIAVSHTVAC